MTDTTDRPLGYWLKLVDSLISQQFALTLEEHGVTRLQWQLLNTLAKKPATHDELTHALAPFLAPTPDDEPATLDEHLAELVESGWIVSDGGVLSLTAQGSTGWEKLDELVAQMRESSSANISSEEYATTVASLRKMAQNLGWDGAEAPGETPA
ncbi:MarR family winged helix-turn-helix transcriptional regulator [Zhihengliuella flava]|uniref:DNA-binding MarR family transcriptional regulator n=1 Tax=Zhihengliuella flava TaxID=1285193 RepID=A0A931DCH9_9MICC|nr:MarR family transcriptional regulator [Zhihengliuella flava]MBG6084911.1 DNA-binding MarR family transcriptional regulator [Zhihengliuella flava]